MAREMLKVLPPGLEHPSQLGALVDEHRLSKKGLYKTPEGQAILTKGLIKAYSRLGVNKCGSLNGYDEAKERSLLKQIAILEDLQLHANLLP